MSRSANGKLMAVAESTIVGAVQTVWNMRTREPAARLAPPAGANVRSLAFSWKGNKLWLISEKRRGELFLQTWDIPAELQDPATDTSYPDQIINRN